MKKTYTNPAIVLREMEEELMQSVSDSETVTTPVHADDPQDPGNALSRRGLFWADGDE